MNIHDLIAANIVRDAFEANKVARNGKQPDTTMPEPRALRGRNAIIPKDQAEDDAQAFATAEQHELAAAASQRIAGQSQAIIASLLHEQYCDGEIDSENAQELIAAGTLKGFRLEDGSSQWELNGNLLIHFWPPGVAFEDGNMLVNLFYKVAL